MPIVGCAISTKPEKGPQIEKDLVKIPGVEVFGGELKKENNIYYIVAVLDALRFEELERMEKQIKNIDGVLHVAVVEAHFLDEFEKIEKGEIKPKNPFHGLKRAEKEAEKAWLGDEEGKDQ